MSEYTDKEQEYLVNTANFLAGSVDYVPSYDGVNNVWTATDGHRIKVQGDEGLDLEATKAAHSYWLQNEPMLKPLHDEIAALNATIQAQQANLQIAADLLAEERAKVAHRDELLRIQGEACERYKAAISHAKSLLGKNTEFKPLTFEAFLNLQSALEETTANDGTPVIHLPPKASEGAPPPRITYSIDSETEAIPTANAAPKFKVGDRVRIKETGQTAIIIETNIFGLHFFDTNATGLRGGFYDSDLRYEESESE